MKKLLSLTAAMLLCFLAHSQEAEVTGSHAEVTIIPRLDLSPNFEDSKLGFTHGNSSIYTLFEGSVGEHFSWTLVNHWLSSLNTEATPEYNYGWPYVNLGYSDSVNWIDFLKFDLSFGNWTFTLGKDMLTTLGFEYERWDWEVNFDFITPFFSVLPCYQWGGKIAYTTNSGMSTFSAQMTTSPYGERPFSSRLWAYSAQWRGEYGFFEPIWSYSALQYGKGAFQHVFTLGNRFSFGEAFALTLDWTAAACTESYKDTPSSMVENGFFNCVRGEFSYAPSERFEASLNSYWNKPKADDTSFCIGGEVRFYPLKDSQDLRLHGSLAYNTYFNYFGLTVGALYNLRIRCW